MGTKQIVLLTLTGCTGRMLVWGVVTGVVTGVVIIWSIQEQIVSAYNEVMYNDSSGSTGSRNLYPGGQSFLGREWPCLRLFDVFANVCDWFNCAGALVHTLCGVRKCMRVYCSATCCYFETIIKSIRSKSGRPSPEKETTLCSALLAFDGLTTQSLNQSPNHTFTHTHTHMHVYGHCENCGIWLLVLQDSTAFFYLLLCHFDKYWDWKVI